MATILEAKHLKKYFKTPKGMLHAVDDVSFSIEAGKTLGVVGESGCGKSTLGRVLIHLLERTDGQIIFEGKDISDLKKSELNEIRKDMQMIFQDPFASLNPRQSVSEIIAEPLQIYHRAQSKQDLEKQVLELMDMRIPIMNKTELIAEVANKAGLSRKDAEKALGAVVETITEAVVKGDKVQLVGFGSFETKQREARTGRNPKTKETIEIPATRVPVFKAGKALKDAVAE